MKTTQQISNTQSNRTQFSDLDPAARPVDVAIGLDFGTATTKVVMRTFYEPDKPGFAVDFGAIAHCSNKYLLSTKLWISESGEVALRRSNHATQLIDFKYQLMNSGHEERHVIGITEWRDHPSTASAAYLALVLQSARTWFLENQNRKFPKRPVRWSVNVGLPSENFDNKLLCAKYLKVCSAAWELSVSEKSLTWEDVNRQVCLGEPDQAALNHIGESSIPDIEVMGEDENLGAVISLMPEVVAEVAGYANSFQRTEGVHFLIDVGASTIDICSFILHEQEGEDQYEILGALVEPLGTSRLQDERINITKKLSNTFQKYFSEMLYHEPSNPLPIEHGEYLPSEVQLQKELDLSQKELKEVDKIMLVDCRKAVARIAEYTRKDRDPRSSCWKTKVPVFVAGGGSNLPIYSNAVKSIQSG